MTGSSVSTTFGVEKMHKTSHSFALGTSVALILAYLIFPIIVVVGISFNATTALRFPPNGWSLRWYEQLFSSSEWTGSFLISLQVGTLTMILSVLIGVPAAFALSRYKPPGRKLINALLLSALIAPPVVRALSTYLFYVPLGLNNTILGLAIAHSVGGIPFVVINTVAGLRSFDTTLERAAIIHGAHPFIAVITITLKVIFPSIMVGAIFAFMQSLQELLISIFVLGTLGSPLAVKMWEGVRVGVDPTIAAASSMLVVLAAVVFGIVALAKLATDARGSARAGAGE